MKQIWPAPERNKGPILEVLRRVLPSEGRVLEIASGSGQHVVHFAASLPKLTFLPTDVEAENLASIDAHVVDSGLVNVEAPQRLDVCDADWNVGVVDAVFCANMIHIAPWECTLGLLAGAARSLAPGGVLVTYGPYRIASAHTAPSNAAFDADLRARDPRWGVRDLDDVRREAERVGLDYVEHVAMPANNLTVVFRRR